MKEIRNFIWVRFEDYNLRRASQKAPRTVPPVRSQVSDKRFWRQMLYIMEKAMGTHSSTLAWEIPWMEQPGWLQSMGSRRVGHNWLASLSRFTFMQWRRKWQPTPVFLPGESQGGAWWVDVYGVAQSQTWLTRLSSSSSVVVQKKLTRHCKATPSN